MMEYYFEVSKMLEAGLYGDCDKVALFGQRLAEKLQEAGEGKAAIEVRRIIERRGGAKLAQAKTVAHSSQQPKPTAQSSPLPVDNESRFSLADETVCAVDDVDLVLPCEVSSRIDEFMAFIEANELLTANGVGFAPSLLMSGPPGCGKTELAKLIAARLSLPLVTARADSIISSYLGSTAKNLRALFEHAKSRPCVLFLDEFDALAKLRDDQHELGELKRVVVSLLQNFDSLDGKVVVLAATNHEHLLDPAVWRRFSFKLKLREPNRDDRAKIFSMFMKSFADDLVCSAGAALADKLSGAEIRTIAEDCVRQAVLSRSPRVDPVFLGERIERYRSPGGSGAFDAEVLSLQLRKSDPRHFTFEKISELTGVPASTLCTRLKKGKSNATKPT